MNIWSTCAIAGVLLASSQAAAAGPIACGATYTVQKSDTLFKIAKRAYGDGHKYRFVFEANRNVLPDTDSLEVDIRLVIPCLDGSGTAIRKDALAADAIGGGAEPPAEPSAPGDAPQETIAATPAAVRADGNGLVQAAAGFAAPARTEPVTAAADQDIRLLTGAGFAPYAGADLPGGGIVTALISQALEAAAPDVSHGVSYVDDWTSHIGVLLPIGAFEIGFPWLTPDCGQPAALDAAQRQFCDRFAVSQPIQSIEVGYYTRVDDPLTGQTDIGALSGKRLCLPRGHVSSELARMGLVAPGVTLATDLTARQCFERLAAGEVDAVAMPKPEGDAQMHRSGLDAEIVEVAGLRTTHSLHAIAPKSNPDALADLALIDRGVTMMMRSGQWFAIVSNHLAELSAQTSGF